MAADQRKNLERFMRQQAFRTRETGLDRFVLRSVGLGGKPGAEVDTFTIAPDITGDNIAVLVEEVLARAQSDADGMGARLTRYTLVACEPGVKDGARFNFRVRGEGDEDEEGTDELQPSEKGLAAQAMRHTEAMMRMFVTSNSAMISGLAKRLESTEKLLDTMVVQRHADLELLEASRSNQHQRDMEMLEKSGSEDRKSEAFKKLEQLFPLLMNKISGQKMLPEGAAGDVFKTLADSLSPEQLQKLAPLLSPEQQMLLMSLLQAARTPPPNGNVS